MEYDVTIDRDRYIGGSDIPVIMGISPHKTRWELLQEKAGLKENEFVGNRYTLYGQTMEPKIRDYINEISEKPFVPNKVTVGDIRCHTDGFNGETVLEIKTTSHTSETLDGYKLYIVQLLKYMEVNDVVDGLLAVYERPDDLNTDFDALKLRMFPISMSRYINLLAEINAEIERFRSDLERLKKNPLLTEQDFQAVELAVLSKKVIALEQKLADIKEIEKQCKEAKQALFDEMVKHDVKSWTTPNGTRITRVDGTAGTVKLVTEFDVETFKAENDSLYRQYLHEVVKTTSGRSGYVKITLPKE